MEFVHVLEAKLHADSVKMSQPAFIKGDGSTRVMAEGQKRGKLIVQPEYEGNSVIYIKFLEGCTCVQHVQGAKEDMRRGSAGSGDFGIPNWRSRGREGEGGRERERERASLLGTTCHNRASRASPGVKTQASV